MKIATICVALAFISQAFALRGTREQRGLESVPGDYLAKQEESTSEEPSEEPTLAPTAAWKGKEGEENDEDKSESPTSAPTAAPSKAHGDPAANDGPGDAGDFDVTAGLDVTAYPDVTADPDATNGPTSLFAYADGSPFVVEDVPEDSIPFVGEDGALYADEENSQPFVTENFNFYYSHAQKKGKGGSKVSELVWRAWIAYNKCLTSCRPPTEK
jgi:hypothetical protein